MGFRDRIDVCHRWQPDRYRPFLIGDARHGWIDAALARRLRDFPAVFDVDVAAVRLSPALDSETRRTAAMADVLAQLRESGDLPYWRDELYPVTRDWSVPPVMLMERGAVPRFGVRAFGVHLNGLVRRGDEVLVWVARRSLAKEVAPGKLDNSVAGGQPHGLSFMDNLVKECAEEAGIPPALACQARQVAVLEYVCEQPDGLRDDVAVCFDLWLPADFVPRNTDGEVESFELWPLARAMAVVRDSDAFKFNCALVLIDLFDRLGALGPDDPDYDAIVAGLGRSLETRPHGRSSG